MTVTQWKVILNGYRVYYFDNFVDSVKFARMYDCPTPYPA